MEDKIKVGLADSAMTEFDNVKNLREEFIKSGASKAQIDALQKMMQGLLDMYIELTEPSKE